MEYLSDKPFKVGGYSRAYADRYDAIFRPIPIERLTAAKEDRDGDEGTMGSPEEKVVEAEAQRAVFPVPPVAEAGKAVAPEEGPGGRTP